MTTPGSRRTRGHGILTFGGGRYAAAEREWLWAEQIGFDSAWIPDTFSRPGLSDLEQWTLLAALARATSRLRIGTLISTPLARHPTLLAASALTVDEMSGGRVEVGLGVGDEPRDFEAFGQQQWSARERASRLEEQVILLDRLLRGGSVSHDSVHYGKVRAEPTSSVQQPRPPLIVAAEGPRALGIAARYADAWCTLGGRFRPGAAAPSHTEAIQATRERVQQLDQHCRDAGRDPKAVRRIVLAFRQPVDPLSSIDAFDEFVGSYAEVGMQEFVLYWPPVAVLRDRGEVSADRRATIERIASARFGIAI